MTTFSPKRPYLVRAMHEWLSDNELTPYLLVDANHPELAAPTEYAQNGQLVLNASYTATHNLYIDNEAISFSARFGGVSQDLWVPMAAVLGIYAKEDHHHILTFHSSEYQDIAPSSKPVQKQSTQKQSTEQQSTTTKTSPFKIIK